MPQALKVLSTGTPRIGGSRGELQGLVPPPHPTQHLANFLTGSGPGQLKRGHVIMKESIKHVQKLEFLK